MVFAFAPAAHAIPQKAAEKKALKALRVQRGDDPVIVFRLAKPVRAGARIGQAGSVRQPTRGRRARTGVLTSRLPALSGIRLRGEKAYLFYADLGPFQAYQHPGRVALVGRRSGKVRISARTSWPPLIDGRLPAFMRSAAAYRDRSNWAFYRPWRRDAVAQGSRLTGVFARSAAQDPQQDFLLRRRVAQLLAAEGSCVVRVSDTLGNLYDFGAVDRTRARLGAIFQSLEDLAPGFVDERYTRGSGLSPTAFVERLIERRGCRDVLLYVAGGAWPGSASPAVSVGVRPGLGGRVVRQHLVAADEVRSLLREHGDVTFKVVIDAPYSGGFVEALRGEGNALLLAAPGGSRQRSFAYLPEVELPGGQILRHPGNPEGLLEFTNRALVGLERLVACGAEIESGAADQAAGRTRSFLAWMIARAFALGADQEIGGGATVGPCTPLVNRGPAANALSVETDEDTAVAVTLAGTDPDGDALTFAASAPAHGTLTGSGAQRTYAPHADFHGTDSFTYTVSDGRGGTATATVTITVTPVPDDPVVDTSPGAASYTENAPATPIDSAVSVTDVDPGATITGATVQITGGYAGAQDILALASPGSHPGITAAVSGDMLTLDGSASVAAYQAALRDVTYRNGSASPSTTGRTITFAVTDETARTGSDTKGLTVTADDNPPVAVNDSATVLEDAPASAIDVLANDTDVDGGPKSVASVTQPPNGTVVITGAGTGLTYQPDPDYCNSQPAGTLDTFTYTLNGGSIATVSVTVTCADDPPTAVDDSATVGEDSGANAIDVLANDTDIDAGPRTIGSAGDPANGTVVITGAGTGLTYEPDPNYCNTQAGGTPDTFTYTLNGGSTATVAVTVTCAPDDPVLDTSVGSTSYTENGPGTPIDSAVTVSDPDAGAMITGATVQITGGYAGAEDVLALASPGSHPGITPSVAGDTLTLTGTASPAAYQAALRDVTYRNSSDTPSTAARTITFTVTDETARTGSDTKGLTVIGVDDPPTAVDDSATVGEDSGANAIDALANDTDIDGGPRTVGSASDPANGTVVITGGGAGLTYQPGPDYCNTQLGGTPDTFTYTLNGGSTATVSVTVTCVDDPPLAVNDSATVLEDAAATAVPVLANDMDVDGGPTTIGSASDPANGTVVITGGGTGLTYQPDPNYCNDPPGTTPDTFTYTLNGGSTATVSVTVTCVNDAPNADDESFSGNDSAHGNTAMVVNDPDDAAPNPAHPKTTVTGDILAGDTDIDGPGPLTVTAETKATADGGSVTIESDGDFTFHPAASTSCTDTSDSFTYTVEDSGSPEMTDTGQVTIAIAGCVWYVNNTAAGNGTSAAPFGTLAQAETASGANHTVFVFDGDNTSTGLGGDGYAMNAGERLIGEHEGLVVDPDQGGALTADTLHPANTGAHPTLTVTNADVIDLGSGNEVRGLTLDPNGAGSGIAGASGDNGGTIDDVNILDTPGLGTQPALELDGTSGTFAVSNLQIGNSGVTGVRLNNAGTVAFAPTGTISIATSGAKGLDAVGTNMGTSVFDTISVSSPPSPTGGVSMTNTTGTTTFGDLALFTNGVQAAFSLSNAGTVSVPAAGTANITAAGGPAVDVTGTSGATLAFDGVISTGSAGDGINLAGLGTGTFSAESGAIGGAAGIAFDLDGGSGAVTYPGALNNGTGATAEITGRSGGAVALSGAIADNNDAGGGITVSGNTGGSTTFSNASKVLNTGTSPAVTMSTSDGHTLTLSGGGLDIDATNGAGVTATASGTLVISGTGNTIETTTGRALNVSATDIGAADLTLQSISANGADSGIVLNSTGTSGGLTVTGDGAVAHSGGTIQNTTSHAISLTSTTDVDLTRLRVMGADRAGVRGTDVTNFSHTNSTLSDVGDSRVNDQDAAFAFNTVGANNVDGQLTLTGNTVTNPYGGGVQVRNAAGTISQANVSTNAIQSTTDPATSKQDGVSFHIEGTPSTAAGLTQAAINSNTLVNFPSGSGVELVGEQITSTTGPRATFGVPDSTVNRVVVSGNDIRGNATNKMGVFGVAASVTGMADGNVRIANNGTAGVPMQNILGEAIGVGASGTANADFVIENNFVAPGNILGNVGISANANRRDVGGTIVATPDVNATIQNNTVSSTSGAGIKVLHFNSNGNLRAKVVNNTVSAPVQPNPGIAVENGSSNDPAFNPTLCAQISSNPATGSGPDGFGNTFPGIDLIERGASNTTYRLQIHGLTPNPATAAQTETFLAGQNPASSLGGGFYAGKRASVSEGNAFEACTITF